MSSTLQSGFSTVASIDIDHTRTTVFPLSHGVIRTFDSGATRDSDEGKFDYEGCLSPSVLERFGEYMYSHSIMADGSRRPSDNWQKGIPLKQYMKSLWRHLIDAWKIHRGIPALDKKTGSPITMENALCALMFNTMGYLHEYLKGQDAE